MLVPVTAPNMRTSWKYALFEGIQSADSILTINLLTSDMFTVNDMWTN